MMQRQAFTKQKPAEITLFLTLTLLLIAAVLCVTIEGARMAAGRWYFQNAAANAAESCMASYHTELWEKYRLMFYEDEDLETALTENLMAYARKENGINTLSAFTEGSVSVTGRTYMAEQGGQALVQNAVTAILYEEVGDLILKQSEESQLLSELTKTAAFAQEFIEYGKDLIELETLFSELKGYASSMITAAQNLTFSGELLNSSLTTLAEETEKLEAAQTAAEAITQNTGTEAGNTGTENREAGTEDTGTENREAGTEDTGAEDTGEENADNREAGTLLLNTEAREFALNDSESMINEMLVNSISFASSVSSLTEAILGYENLASALGTGLKNLADRINQETADFSPEFKNALNGIASSLEVYTSGTEERQKFLTEIHDLADKYQNLDNLPETLSQVSLSELSGSEVRSLIVKISSYTSALSDFTGFSVPSWLVNMGTASDGTLKNSLISVIQTIALKGVLSLFIEDIQNVSASVMVMEDRPSAVLRSGSLQSGLLQSVTDKLLFVEYLSHYFGGYTQDKGTQLKYEWEYLVNGYLSDTENLTASVSELYSIRTGTRFLENIMSQETKEKASAAATAAVGFTSNAAIIQIAAYLFMGIWAADDALTDVQNLLKGEKTALLPTGMELSYQVSYEDYLKLEMYLVPFEDLCYRAMDLMQYNIRSSQSDFQIARCLSGFEMQASGKLPWMFADLPLVTEFVDISSSGATLSAYESCSY